MTGDPILGVRRVAELEAGPDPGDEPGLVDAIRTEIRATGRMTFARFMERALYDPELGYYATGRRGPGRGSDFLTSPESHPIFGWTIARQLTEVWDRLGRPIPFTVREYGAGTGALAAGIIDGLARAGSPLRAAIRYQIAERSPDRTGQVAERLAGAGAGDVLEPEAGDPVVGAVLANEVLDALPVHRVIGREDGEIEELFVGLDAAGKLMGVAGPPSTSLLRDRLDGEGIRLAPGQLAEICLAVRDWVAVAAAGLDRGLLLLADYGYPAAALYDPSRGSLLRAYVRHRVHDDPFANVGRQDLTAHVDLTTVERAATASGLDHLGTTTQAAFLAGLAAGELLVGYQGDPHTTLEAYLDAQVRSRADARSPRHGPLRRHGPRARPARRASAGGPVVPPGG